MNDPHHPAANAAFAFEAGNDAPASARLKPGSLMATVTPKIAALLSLLLAGGATAQGVAAPASEDAADQARRTVRATAEWLASGVDSWFGDKPFSDGGKVSEGRFSVDLLHRDDSGTDVNVRFNARFRLPNLSEKSYFYLGRDNRRDLVTDRPAAFTRQQRLLPESARDRSFFAGVGRELRDDVDFRLGFRGGLKPYAQVRYRKPWLISQHAQAEFRQTFFWSVDDRLGSTTALSYDQALTSRLALRWVGTATLTQDSRNLEWGSVLGAYRDFSGSRLLSLEALFNDREGSGVTFTDYGAQLKWQQPLHRKWLLGQVVVGHFWPRPDDSAPRGRTWALGAGLEIRF